MPRQSKYKKIFIITGVQNCSGYYVYELRGVPKCQARMCMVANGRWVQFTQ